MCSLCVLTVILVISRFGFERGNLGSEASCSKLTALLVNVSLKYKT